MGEGKRVQSGSGVGVAKFIESKLYRQVLGLGLRVAELKQG